MFADNTKARAVQLRGLSSLAKIDPPEWECSSLAPIRKNKYIHLKCFLSRRHRSHQGVVTLKEVDRFISSRGKDKVDWRSLLKICAKGDMEKAQYWDAEYWTNPSRKEGVSFVALDGNLLISRGLYKVVLARYALHYRDSDTLYGAKVSNWSVDWGMYETYIKLRGICKEHYPHFHLMPERTKVSEAHHGHGVVDDYLLTIRRENKDNGRPRFMCALEARDWLAELEEVVGLSEYTRPVGQNAVSQAAA